MIDEILFYVCSELKEAERLSVYSLNEFDRTYFNGKVDAIVKIKNKIEEFIRNNRTTEE